MTKWLAYAITIARVLWLKSDFKVIKMFLKLLAVLLQAILTPFLAPAELKSSTHLLPPHSSDVGFGHKNNIVNDNNNNNARRLRPKYGRFSSTCTIRRCSYRPASCIVHPSTPTIASDAQIVAKKTKKMKKTTKNWQNQTFHMLRRTRKFTGSGGKSWVDLGR